MHVLVSWLGRLCVAGCPLLWQPALRGKLSPLSVGDEAFWTLPAYASILIFFCCYCLRQNKSEKDTET